MTKSQKVYIDHNKNIFTLFFYVIKGNKTLKEFFLGNNHFEENAAKWFRDGLSENDTLEVLDLGWNPWKTKGAVCLAEGLAVINYANRK